MKKLLTLISLIFLSIFSVDFADAKSNRKALREAAGRYDGRFTGVLNAPNIEARRFIAKGFVKVPAGKGKGRVVLATMGRRSNLPAFIKKVLVRQGGTKVLYRGKNGIPDKLTPNLGALVGPFEATVMLKRKHTIKTNSKMGNGQGSSVNGSFKGTDEELQ